jgi:hypothetical protein
MVVQDDENVAVVLAKGMSGMGGGLIGAAKAKPEFQDLIAGMQETVLA